jgi:hypothetical protein
MYPSDSLGIAAQCERPVAAASRSMTAGSVASWKTTMSGAAGRMTASSASSRPVPPRLML